MTEILCRWLNSELCVSQEVDQKNFAEKFASGYLLGEVLKKYELQDDFDSFSQSRTADSKLNNFTRLEPTLHLLEVPFDTNMAHGIMQEQPGVATRLMYQLYIALHNKQQSSLTGVAMETMRPRAPVKLESLERGPYKERLKILTPRQTDLNLDELVEKFRERKRQHLDIEFRTRYKEDEKKRHWQQEQRLRELQKAADARKRQTELVARIKAAAVEMPKPPPNKTLKAISARREMVLKREASEMRQQIAEFENQLSRSLNVAQEDKDADDEVAIYLQQQDEKEKTKPELVQLIRPASNDQYISKIRKRLQEDATARQEREKRRRKVLVDQLRAHDVQEETRREELLVNRLMRQSQQERRIATQLLQLRHEKAIICQNRIYREQQYEERRQKDFQEALDKEAELARLAKLEYIEQTKRDKELHDKIAQERAEAKYQKRYNICNDILLDIVDLACKVGKYRELTERQLPAKLLREWKMLFSSGKSLYEKAIEAKEEEPMKSQEDQLLDKERKSLLDEGDFMEYKNMTGEWQPPLDSDINGPQKNNAILGHILARIFSIVSPPTPPPPPPEIPPFPVKACFVGKAFTGKSTTASRLSDNHGLAVLNIDDLVCDAVDAYKDGEVMDEPVEALTEGEPVEGAGGDTQAAVPVSSDEIPSVQLSTPGDITVTPATRSIVQANVEAKDDKDKVDDEKPVEGTVEGEGQDKPSEGESSEMKTNKKPSSPAKKKGAPKAEPTPRAKLGKQAVKFLRKGQPVKDELLVDIMVEAVKHTPVERGWIMDGFPSTLAQAKLLEKALSGYDASTKPSKTKLTMKQSRLAPDPSPPKEPPPGVSGIDLVVLFEAPDELVLKRAAGRTYASQSGEQYQQEFRPPPEGSCTGVGKQEKVSAVKDTAHDQEQIQHRLTGFQDSWKKLDKWFSSFGILHKVDVATEPDEAYSKVEHVMVETKEKIEKSKEDVKKREDELLKVGTEGSAVGTASEVPMSVPTDEGMDSLATQPPDSQPGEVSKESTSSMAPGSPKGSRTGSPKRSGSARKRSPKRGDESPKRDKTPKGTKKDKEKREGSRSGSPKRASSSGKGKRGKSGSPKRGRSGRKSPKREPTPEPEPEPEPPVPTGPPPPQPGSEDWLYVDELVDEALAVVLAAHWENTESTYVESCKHVFHSIRSEREDIYHYFYKVRRDFEKYLRRPDGKQEFLSAWQQEYNDIAEDMRDDDETKAELHQRVEDLKEQLWEISDQRKVDAETERTAVMAEGWLEDRLGLLTNHYLTLMQSEVDRYQDTLRLLKDYYQGMEGKIPEEFDASFVRIPLIDLSTATERPSSAPISVPASESVTRAITPTTPSAKAGKKGKEPPPEETKEETEEEKPKIPLVPRRPTSTEGFFPSQTPAGKAEKVGKSRGGKKEKDKPAPAASLEETQESPLPPADNDEKLISDAFQFGIVKISEITAAELAARDAEDEAEKLREAERDKEKDKAAAAAANKKLGKKPSKSKSPSGKRSPSGGKKSPAGKKSPKKGKKAATPTPPPTPPPATEDTPEEKAKKELRDRMKQEYLAAISHEENGLKIRMELIKIHDIAVLQELKGKSEEVYKDMDDWLGGRFQQEMASIDTLAEVLGEKIEKKEKIQLELVSFQDDFLINQAVKVFRTPSPAPRPSPIEIALPDTFTVDQLKRLQQQFVCSAPSGFISNKGFMDTLSDMTALTRGSEALPDNWMALTLQQLDQLATILSPDCEYVDWRTFMLQIAQPWSQPTQAQLLETLSRFRDVDMLNTGTITREQYEQFPLWYVPDPRPPTPDDPSLPLPFDRVTNVQKLFFNIFADHSLEPPLLDYTNMLLYFSVDLDAMNGFFRALSVASGKHMPRPRLEEVESREKQLDQLNVMKEVVEVITGSEIRLQDKRVEPSLGPPEEGIPSSALHATVDLKALVQVLHHGRPTLGDSHRFSVTSDPEDTFSQERLASIYRELAGSDNNKLSPVPFFTLMDHPIIQDCLSLCRTYKTPDLRPVFAAATSTVTADNDANSVLS